MKPSRRQLIRTFILGALAAIAILCMYFVWWGIAYRQPHAEPITVDLRESKTNGSMGESGRCLMICAALANNPHGFPGHCYVVWDCCSLDQIQNAHSDGFIPAQFIDLIPSLFGNVRGLMARHAAFGNTRNLDYILVRVNDEQYQKARDVVVRYVKDTSFQTGVRDCVAYADDVSRALGLKTPSRSRVYPLDYLKALKEANQSHSASVSQQPESTSALVSVTKE